MSATDQDDQRPVAHEDAPITPGSVINALPGLVRIGFGASRRTAEWTMKAGLDATGRLLRAATSGESAAELIRDARAGARASVRDMLGVVDVDELKASVPQVSVTLPRRETAPRDEARDDGPAVGAPSRDGGGSPPASRDGRRSSQEPSGTRSRSTVASLRERGEALLRASADVRFEEEAHPAYGRILSELAPDEGRILRFLALEGPQPAVDVRVSKTMNVGGTQLVAPGLNMIGAQAGCRYLDRVPAYLDNLNRLGLIWFSREPLDDPMRYQILEAQPDVVQAMRRRGRAKTVRRSIRLTPFGDDFCNVCLPLHTAELEALPGGTGPVTTSPSPDV